MIDRIKNNKVFIIVYIVIIIALALMTSFNNKYLLINNDTNPYNGISENDRSTMKIVDQTKILQYSYFIFNIAVSSILVLIALIITNNKNNTLKFKWITTLGIIVLYAFVRFGVKRYVGDGVENIEEVYRGFIGASVAIVLYIITIIKYSIKPAAKTKNVEESAK